MNKNVNTENANQMMIKKWILSSLYLLSAFIMLSGIFFTAYSLIADISFPIFGTQVHGFVFGLLVFYLGLRYFLSVKNIKEELLKPSSKFSWKNFNKNK